MTGNRITGYNFVLGICCVVEIFRTLFTVIVFFENLEETSKLIGRVRKNSGGKRQAHYQPHVCTGKRRPDQLMVLGYYTHRPGTSGITLVRYLSGQTERRQRR